jgi:hypothetical protein
MWLNPDKTIGAIITDVFNMPIHLIGQKEGSEYALRGWRGDLPVIEKMPLIDDNPDDGLPRVRCKTCDGRLFWRAPLERRSQQWRCIKCEPADPLWWLDGSAVP